MEYLGEDEELDFKVTNSDVEEFSQYKKGDYEQTKAKKTWLTATVSRELFDTNIMSRMTNWSFLLLLLVVI